MIISDYPNYLSSQMNEYIAFGNWNHNQSTSTAVLTSWADRLRLAINLECAIFSSSRIVLSIKWCQLIQHNITHHSNIPIHAKEQLDWSPKNESIILHKLTTMHSAWPTKLNMFNEIQRKIAFNFGRSVLSFPHEMNYYGPVSIHLYYCEHVEIEQFSSLSTNHLVSASGKIMLQLCNSSIALLGLS